MRTIARLLLVSLAATCLIGCPPKTGTVVPGVAEDFEKPLPPGRMGLVKITDPAQIPNFTQACSDVRDLRQAVENSINYMSKPSSKEVYAKAYGQFGQEFSHERTLTSLKAFAAILDSNTSPEQMNTAIRSQFDVYTSVGWNGKGEVLFTGYYTPIFNASPTRTEQFKYPLYRQPADLKKAPDGTTLTPYPSRKELETTQAARLNGLELYYLADPFEVYIAHVQGSARLRMSDGSLVTVGYAANNGQEYVSIGKELIADGKIPKGKMSLRAIIEYFKAHPNEVATYTQHNPRFVFFDKFNSDPRGCLNEPVTPWRSIATDKTIFPRAAITMVAAGMPRRNGNLIDSIPCTLFAMDQDAGGAIRAPGRCDMYMGVGDEAGELAGRTQEKGRLYYLLIKQTAK
jgi:membrane-bound lytic murein transglycosylase A